MNIEAPDRDIVLDHSEYAAISFSLDAISQTRIAIAPLRTASDSVALVAYDRVVTRLNEIESGLRNLAKRAAVRS